MRKSRFLIIIISGILIYLTTFNSKLFAFNKEFDPSAVKVDITINSISVSWGHIADQYIIYLDEKEISSTKKESFKFNNLEENHPYGIRIQAIDGEQTLDNIVIQTVTLMSSLEKKKKQYTIEDAVTIAIFTDKEAKIMFSNVPDDDDKFDVYRNNSKKVGEITSQHNFVYDTDLKPETNYRYSIVGKVKLAKEEKQNLAKNLKKQNMPETIAYDDNLNKEYEVARSFKTLKREENFSASAAENWEDPTPGVEFIYSTFIPMGVFDFSIKGSDYNKFKGDGRDFDKYVTNDKYRTRTVVRVSFPTSGKSRVWYDEDAHATEGKNKKTGKWVSKRTSLKDIYLKTYNVTTDKATFTVYHNAANPLHNIEFGPATIPAPGITYQYSGEVYKTGFFKLTGYHDNAPNHEMSFTPIPGETHGMYYNGKYQITESTMQGLFADPIYTKNMLGFFALVPGMPQKAIFEQGYWK